MLIHDLSMFIHPKTTVWPFFVLDVPPIPKSLQDGVPGSRSHAAGLLAQQRHGVSGMRWELRDVADVV